jgi:hypothetical protein
MLPNALRTVAQAPPAEFRHERQPAAMKRRKAGMKRFQPLWRAMKRLAVHAAIRAVRRNALAAR